MVIDDPRHADYGYVQRENADADAPNSTAALAYGSAATIDHSSADTPTLITTSAAHGLATGVPVLIAGHVGATPDLNGSHEVTVISPTTFTIPIAVSVGGSGGTVQATIVQQEVWNGDSDPPTKAIVDAATAGAIADFELRWAALQAEQAELATFLDPRRDAREFYTVEIAGIESGQLFGVRGWQMTLARGAIMRHTIGRARELDIVAPAKS